MSKVFGNFLKFSTALALVSVIVVSIGSATQTVVPPLAAATPTYGLPTPTLIVIETRLPIQVAPSPAVGIIPLAVEITDLTFATRTQSFALMPTNTPRTPTPTNTRIRRSPTATSEPTVEQPTSVPPTPIPPTPVPPTSVPPTPIPPTPIPPTPVPPTSLPPTPIPPTPVPPTSVPPTPIPPTPVPPTSVPPTPVPPTSTPIPPTPVPPTHTPTDSFVPPILQTLLPPIFSMNEEAPS